MNELFSSLLVWASTLMGYQQPIELPRILPVAHEALSDKLCNGQFCTAVAYYDSETQTIFYDQRLDLQMEHGGRGFIIHELAHYIQDKQGKFTQSAITDCEQRIGLEREAYRVQRYFLLEHGQDVFQIDLAITLLDSICLE